MNNSSTEREQIDRHLEAIRGGNSEAENELWQYVYDKLHQQARNLLRLERQGHTLQATALVHEAYLDLAGNSFSNCVSAEHFFNITATVMRHILVDHARKRRRPKHNPGQRADEIELDNLPNTNTDEGVIWVDEMLNRLEKIDKRQAKIVEHRYFSGLTNEEIAPLMGISEATVKRDWRHAKTWLKREMKP